MWTTSTRWRQRSKVVVVMNTAVLASFCSVRLTGLLGILAGAVPLLMILFVLSAVVKGRRRRGNGLAVACLILMLAAMATLWMRVAPKRHTFIETHAPRAAAPAMIQSSDPVPPPVPHPVVTPPKISRAEAEQDRGKVSVVVADAEGNNVVTRIGHEKPDVPEFIRKYRPKVVWSVIMACAIGGLMFVGYIALDAGTRGQLTWSLRILSLLCFGAIVTTVVALRHAL